MNFGEIRVFRFQRAHGGAEAIPSNLGIDAAAQLVIVDEKMPIIFDVFVAIAHVYRETCLSTVIEIRSEITRGAPASRQSDQMPVCCGADRPLPSRFGSQPRRCFQ
jgi:hypothetical protein